MTRIARLTTAGLALGMLWCGTAANAQADVTRQHTDQVQTFKAAKMHYDKAAKLFSKRDYEGARHWARESVAKFPNYSDAHLLAAKSAYMIKDYEDAIQAIARAEETFDAYVALGDSLAGERQEALYRQRRIANDSLNEMQAALPRATTDRERFSISSRIDQLNQQLRDIDREIQEPSTLDRPGLPAEYPFVHGNIFLRMNRLAEAETQYKRALEIQPKYPEAINNLASLYYSAGRGQLALVVINDAEAHGVTVNPELKKAVLEAVK
jgi:tetratricopeptide (TPR) repeat protein